MVAIGRRNPSLPLAPRGTKRPAAAAMDQHESSDGEAAASKAPRGAPGLETDKVMERLLQQQLLLLLRCAHVVLQAQVERPRAESDVTAAAAAVAGGGCESCAHGVGAARTLTCARACT